jgi:predicted ATP-dependent endonuclease of OLD family
MRLKLVKVRNYKRFEKASSLDTRGPLVAIVGPNEAGKTSLLEAIAHLSSRDAFEQRELTNRQPIDDDDWVVQAHFSLDDGDREALGDLVDSKADLTYRWLRNADGNARYGVGPGLQRDLGQRESALEELERALEGWLGAPEPNNEDAVARTERARGLAEELRTDAEDLSEAVITMMGEVADAIEVRVADDEREEHLTRETQLADLLREVAKAENEPAPHARVSRVLEARVPQFLLFGETDRELHTEYPWADHPVAPAALANLFQLAETDYAEFRRAAESDDRAMLDSLQEIANSNLDDAFKAWRQSDIHVAFSADQRSLQLLVRDRATARRTRLDDRSAGLRSFVALIAFTARYAGDVRPVLLIDEAETHLHYGAQADLVRVFERQRAVETIIYTTHSIGCLPSDLGATIRVVSPVEGQQPRSTIHNSFWAAQRRAGLTPMMLAMGANALAFTPSRRAVIGEGPSEAILLPSLIREALPPSRRNDPLGYQVAPGISEVDPDEAADLEMEAGGVAYLIDSDAGGRGHRRKLSERAKSEGRVVVLGDEEGLSIEDFVESTVLADAMNRLLERRGEGGDDRISSTELPRVARGAYLDKWCEDRGVRLNKAALAQEALDLGRDRGRLIDRTRREQLQKLHKRLVTATTKTSGGIDA